MSKFKVIIAGSRDFYDYDFLKEKCKFYLQNKLPNVIIVSGGATGTDSLGEKFAEEMNLEIIIKKPDWNKYGKSAGPKRNKEMSEISDGLIAFWDGKSRGTKNMIETATQNGLIVKVVMI